MGLSGPKGRPRWGPRGAHLRERPGAIKARGKGAPKENLAFLACEQYYAIVPSVNSSAATVPSPPSCADLAVRIAMLLPYVWTSWRCCACYTKMSRS